MLVFTCCFNFKQLEEDNNLRHCPLDSFCIPLESPIIVFFSLFIILTSPEYALTSNLHSLEILPPAIWKEIYARGHNPLLAFKTASHL